ncbi:hypothetical protein ScFU97_13320 [Streptococcus canis]|nr:hypothetical protein ScFU97_13320 [Streptococcus canis]VTR80835.1 membrane protein [Streptococcus canis]
MLNGFVVLVFEINLIEILMVFELVITLTAALFPIHFPLISLFYFLRLPNKKNRLTDLHHSQLPLEALENLEGYYKASLVDFSQRRRIQVIEFGKSEFFVEQVISHSIPDNNGELLQQMTV